MMKFQKTQNLRCHWMSGLPRDRRYTRDCKRLPTKMDQAIAEGCTADEAEARAMEQVQKLGGELLGDWASEKQSRSVAESRRENPSAIKHIKKK